MFTSPKEYRLEATVTAYQVDIPTIFSITGGVISMQPGEWVVEVDANNKFKVSDEAFRKLLSDGDHGSLIATEHTNRIKDQA